MSPPDTIPPPPYNMISNPRSMTMPQWNSPEPELAWYRQQGCLPVGNRSQALEIVINDKTGKSCIGSPERLSNLLDEQIARPPRVQLRIRGTYYHPEKRMFGSPKNFEIWIDAAWLVTSRLPTISRLSGTKVLCMDDQAVDGSLQSWADWIYDDYGRRKVILIEREVDREVSENLKKDIVDCIRETNYGGSIDISIRVDHDKTLITRQEITSQTEIRYPSKVWPNSFSILRQRPGWDNAPTMRTIKKDLGEDIRSFKVFRPQRMTNTDANVEKSGTDSELRNPLQQPYYQATAKLEEVWLSAWRIPLQNAVIEVTQGFYYGARTLTSNDQNDADVVGLRRPPPKKIWGASFFSMRRWKMFQKQ